MLPYDDDIRLSAKLSSGDIAAFNTLYYRYYKAVFSNIIKLVQQQQAAEDILQEVFEALWVNRKKIDREKAVGGWLFVVSYNKSIRFLHQSVRERARIHGEPTVDIVDTKEDDPEAVEYQYHLINEAIENLSPRKKSVFILCKLEGKTYEEAALALGISPHTVKEYVSSSLQFIKEYALSRHALNTSLSLTLLIPFINYL
ncbi:MAG TPA: sigma-70 family RNA polymerase sigma factor [Puia sp.]|nr:sigma-70 family RNA polymerase sigma factor [Puia sp.]